MATFSGAKADIPLAMTSAFTNSVTASVSFSNTGARVDLPAPLGPAITTRLGRAARATPAQYERGMPRTCSPT
jgi:hypothetical protein